VKRALVVCVVLSLAQGCAPSDGETVSEADSLTRAQKDSIVARLPVPGASGVGAALRARDAAAARAAELDSIG